MTNILNRFKEIGSINRIQELAKLISEHKQEVQEIIDNNKLYKQYLLEQGSSVEELFDWCDKIATLDDNMLQLSIFLTSILFAYISVIIFKCRKTFYFIAGIIYMIFIMSVFSNGVSDYLVTIIFNKVSKIWGNIYTYSDMININSIFIQPYKESMVAFIIFDTLAQNIESKKDKYLETELKSFIYSLDYILQHLIKYESSLTLYKLNIMVPKAHLLLLCEKNKKNKRYLRIKRQLTEGEFWLEPHTNKEYIDRIQLVRMEIYQINKYFLNYKKGFFSTE